MISLKKKIVFIGLTTLCLTARAQNADSLTQPETITLQEVIVSLENNPALQRFDEKINANQAYAKSARSLDAPTVSGGLWMFPYSRPEENGMGPENKGAVMIGVEQMIMNPAKRKAEQKYMEGMSSVESAMKSYDRQDMIEEAKKMYYEWIVLKKKQAVLKDSENLIRLMIRSGEIGYTYNQNQLSRIYKAQSELYSIQNMIVMTENEIRQMNIGLNTLMNREKSIRFEVDTNYVIADYEKVPVDTSALKENRSDIRNIDEALKLFSLRKDLEMSRRKPDFGIQYGHMNNFGAMPNQFNLMGMVTIPIAPWASRGYKANIEGIRYETRSLRHRKAALLNEAAGNIEKLKAEILNKKRQMKIYEEHLLPALEKNFNTSMIAFEHMKEDMFMTLDAWMALKMARIEYLSYLGDLLKLQASFERQMENK